MKKNLLLVFSLVTLVACGNNTSTSNTSTSSNVPSNNSSETISSSVVNSSTVSSSTHTHTYSDEWSKDADGHWHESTCGHEATAKETHTWNEGEKTKPATCTEEGEITYTCTVCGFEKVENYDVLGHSYGEVTYTWAEDNSAVTASRTCANDAEHVETETVNTVAEVTQAQTCENNELTTYTATFENEAFETQVKENVVTKEALNHAYGEVTYTWAEDNSTVTASRTCANNAEHVETETVNTTAVVTQTLTCTANELTTYTATFTNEAFETQVKENVVTKEAAGHAYGDVSYVWAEDNSTVTATRTCANDATHVETETVNTASEVTQELTCTANELTTYTATFENEAFEDQIKENVVTKEAEGHKYVDGYCSCNAKDPNHYFVMSIPEALAAEDGEKVEVSGTVSAVNTAWSDSYGNITVTIVDTEGNDLYVYRLATKVELGDIITVKGAMATYNNNRQIAAGATAEITGHDSSYDYVELTIDEALKADDNLNVIVTGTVVKIGTAYSSQYKNISVYIADEDGTQLYLYRLSGNVSVGQIIKVKGVMATYNGQRQVTGGTYELIGTHTCENFTEATCKTPAKCVVCGVAKDDVLADHDYVEGVCSVCGASNTETPVEPNPDTPVVETKKADFNTITTKNAYGDSGYTSTYTTTDGWVTKNCAIQTGGAANNNPTFTVVGPDNTHKAPCLNGKTTAPGSIESPTLTGGVSKIIIDYTKMFTDTKLSVTVTVTELSTGNVYTHDISVTLVSTEKYVPYNDTWNLETAVTGDFTMTIKNNCPSNSTSNKDRMTILNLEWQ